MSRFKSYIKPTLIRQTSQQPSGNPTFSSQSTELSVPRHITQINIGASSDEKPPIPPTPFPMVNRLASNIDESLVHLNTAAQKAQAEREQTLHDLDHVFIELRTHLEYRYRQHAADIKSAYDSYDQHLHQLKCQLEHVREELIRSFPSTESNENDSSLFNVEKYRCLETLTNQTINQTMKEQGLKPNYRIVLTNVDHFDHCYVVQQGGDHSPIPDTCHITRSWNDSHSKQRTMSVETCTSTNGTDDYDNVPNDNYGHYHVSYHQALKAPLRMLERWSCSLESGNYFIPLLSPYRQTSLIMYCLDRESFLCYDARSISSSPSSTAVIKWRGTRPSAVYWFDQMNMLFIACATYIYGCYLDEDLSNDQRFKIRIPIEQTLTWSDTQGQRCWPNFLTCGDGIDRLLYAYWTDRENSTSQATTTTSFTYYQIEQKTYSIKARYSLDGRLRALHSSLSTYRLALLLEQTSNQSCYIEIRTLRDFLLLSKFELRTTFEQFHYGCSLTNVAFDSNAYFLCDHKQNQLWYVNGETGEMKVKHMSEAIYSVIALLDGTLALLVGSPMRFDFIFDPNDSGLILAELFHTDEESFEV